MNARRVSITIAAAIALAMTTAVAQEKVTVVEAPLSWQQAAQADGEEIFFELCAVCHGTDGKGNGPAAAALRSRVPDLTRLTVGNNRIFPTEWVRETIAGKHRPAAHGSVDMPIWGTAFAELRPDLKPYRREGFARQRIYNLLVHIERIQDLSP